MTPDTTQLRELRWVVPVTGRFGRLPVTVTVTVTGLQGHDTKSPIEICARRPQPIVPEVLGQETNCGRARGQSSAVVMRNSIQPPNSSRRGSQPPLAGARRRDTKSPIANLRTATAANRPGSSGTGNELRSSLWPIVRRRDAQFDPVPEFLASWLCEVKSPPASGLPSPSRAVRRCGRPANPCPRRSG